MESIFNQGLVTEHIQKERVQDCDGMEQDHRREEQNGNSDVCAREETEGVHDGLNVYEQPQQRDGVTQAEDDGERDQDRYFEPNKSKLLHYNEVPSNVKVTFQSWFPRVPSNSKDRIPKDVEYLIPEGEVVVMPRAVARFNQLRREDVLASYIICFNILHKNARTVLQNNEPRRVCKMFEYNIFTSVVCQTYAMRTRGTGNGT